MKTQYMLSVAVAALLSFASCESTHQIVHQQSTPVPQTPKPAAAPQDSVEKPQLVHYKDLDFFPYNVSDLSKNDNSASYGSIVSAKPTGYQVTKTYFPSVGQNFRQKLIILHYTALDADRSIRVLTEQSVSAHYLVNDSNDNEIYQLVDENKRAYHAGVSSWRGQTGLNDTSIGIETVNLGYTADAAGNRQFYDYPPYQVKKIAALVKDLADRYNIPPTQILGHSDIAPTRKQDPGPKFPWKQLHDQYGIGMWYDQDTKDRYFRIYSEQNFQEKNTQPQFIFEFQTKLRDFGYGLIPSGTYDKDTEKIVQAFQYHFRPELGDGIMDAETYAVLSALLDKYK